MGCFVCQCRKGEIGNLYGLNCSIFSRPSVQVWIGFTRIHGLRKWSAASKLFKHGQLVFRNATRVGEKFAWAFPIGPVVEIQNVRTSVWQRGRERRAVEVLGPWKPNSPQMEHVLCGVLFSCRVCGPSIFLLTCCRFCKWVHWNLPKFEGLSDRLPHHHWFHLHDSHVPPLPDCVHETFDTRFGSRWACYRSVWDCGELLAKRFLDRLCGCVAGSSGSNPLISPCLSLSLCNIVCQETQFIFKVWEAKRLMGLKVVTNRLISWS